MTAFFRVSGSGNDFLVLVEPPAEPAAAEIAAWCSRGLSAGADGLFVLRREGDAARMIHFNSDGGRASLCLNGTRCAARLALELGWAAERIEILTDAGSAAARKTGPDAVEIALPPPAAPPVRLDLAVDDATLAAWRIDVGVPHLVLPWESGLASAPIAQLGPRLRCHPALGAAGANVDFVRFPSRDRLEVRSFERGVEAETLACGTGILASAAVGVALGRLAPPIEVLTRGGFTLAVDGAVEGDRFTRWTLAGDARLVARGELLPGASAVPSPPAWSP